MFLSPRYLHAQVGISIFADPRFFFKCEVGNRFGFLYATYIMRQMETTALTCPSCGGTVELANRFVKMVVCGYCGNTLAVENDRLDPTGKTAALVDYPTRFKVGQTGHLCGKGFHILGRVRLEDE